MDGQLALQWGPPWALQWELRSARLLEWPSERRLDGQLAQHWEPPWALQWELQSGWL
jgi:hypothetical protein